MYHRYRKSLGGKDCVSQWELQMVVQLAGKQRENKQGKKLGYKMMSRELRTPTHNVTLTVCLCKAGYSCIPLKSAATSLWTIRDVKVVLMVKMVSGVLRRSECFCVSVFAAVIDETGVSHQALCFHRQTHREQQLSLSEGRSGFKWAVLEHPPFTFTCSEKEMLRLYFDLIFGTLDRHISSRTFHHETVNGEVSG